MKVAKPKMKKVLEKGKYRKDVIDLVMILPIKEGTITGGGLITMRVPMASVTNVDFMTGVFRQMWVTLAQKDKDVSKLFESFFKNMEIEKKRFEKAMAKEHKKALAKAGKPIVATEEELAAAKAKLDKMFEKK